MSSIAVAAARSAGQRTRVTIGLALLSALSLGSGCMPPRAIRGWVPAPTLDAPDSPELAYALSGTLTAVRRHGSVTIVDLPSRRELELELGNRVSMVAGPDESGRIVYEARNPRFWEFSPLTLLLDEPREALFVRSLNGERSRVLREYRPTSYSPNLLQLSRRGGRVLYAVHDDLRVYDVEGRELFRCEFSRSTDRTAWLDDDGEVLHFERIEPLAPTASGVPREPRRWPLFSVDLSTGRRREDANSPSRPPVACLWIRRRTLLWWSGPHVADPPAQRVATPDPRGELPGDLGDYALEFARGATIYHGLAGPGDGARAFRWYGPAEHSLRLGERSTGKTLNLVRRFEPGAWTFTDVRVDPKLLGEPAPLRR